MNQQEVDELLEKSKKAVDDAAKAYAQALIHYSRLVNFCDMNYFASGDKDFLKTIMGPKI